MDDTQRTGWQKRILLFLTSQCITLFGSTLVQMALVWYATMQTSSGSSRVRRYDGRRSYYEYMGRF